MASLGNQFLQISLPYLAASANQLTLNRFHLLPGAQQLHPFFRELNFILDQIFEFCKLTFIPNQE
jgi:hypothetical protein